jgi:hypothetical protein
VSVALAAAEKGAACLAAHHEVVAEAAWIRVDKQPQDGVRPQRLGCLLVEAAGVPESALRVTNVREEEVELVLQRL